MIRCVVNAQEPVPGGPDPEYAEIAQALVDWEFVERLSQPSSCAVC